MSGPGEKDSNGQAENLPLFSEWKNLGLEFETTKVQDDSAMQVPMGSLHHFGSAISPEQRKVFVVGGSRASWWDASPCNSFACLSLDDPDPEWTLLPPMPTARFSCTAACVGGKLIVVGGWIARHGAGRHSVSNVVECYDFQSQRWTVLEPLAVERFDCRIAVLNSHECLIVGGSGGGQKGGLPMEKYSVAGSGSTEVKGRPHPNTRYIHAAVAISGDQVLVIGRGNEDSASNMPCCVAVSISTNQVACLPEMVNFPLFWGAAKFENYVMSFHRGKQGSFCQILNLDCTSVGWRVIQNADIPSPTYPLCMSYLAEDRHLIAVDKAHVNKMDLAATFATGMLKYNSLVPLIYQEEVPDSLVPFVLARGGGTEELLHLNFRALRGRPDLVIRYRSRSEGKSETIGLVSI